MLKNINGGGQNPRISFVRMIAMCMILLCHVFQEYGNELAWWFNVGVQIFLVISGFLYGGKRFEQPLPILKKQFVKITLPYYVFLLFVIGQIGRAHV